MLAQGLDHVNAHSNNLVEWVICTSAIELVRVRPLTGVSVRRIIYVHGHYETGSAIGVRLDRADRADFQRARHVDFQLTNFVGALHTETNAEHAEGEDLEYRKKGPLFDRNRTGR